MKRSTSRSFCIAALASWAMLAPASLLPDLMAKDMVPYRGTGYGVPVDVQPLPDGSLKFITAETGQATHFGRYEAQMEVIATFGLDAEGRFGLVLEGQYLQTASDGSSIRAVLSGFEWLDVSPPYPMIINIKITEGTGRFEGAVGSWQMMAESTGDYTYTTEGVISSVGSLRSRK